MMGRVTLVGGDLRAVVFDFFGTLTPGTPDRVWQVQLSRLAAAMGVSAEGLRAALQESFPERITGALGDLPQTLQALAARLGVRLAGEQLDAACRVRRRLQWEQFALRPDALPTIECLRARGLKIGLLSDCTSELPEAFPELPLSALVDAAVFSCVVGFRKPDSRLFGLVTRELGADPGDCLYVGDGGGHELSGARAAGMHPVLMADADWNASAPRDREQNWDGPRIGALSTLCGG